MGFKRKLITWYLILIFVLISCFGFFLYRFNANQLREKAHNDLSFLSDNLSQQLDELIIPMEFVVSHLLSDQKLITATTTLTYIDRSINEKEALCILAKKDISEALYTDYLIRNFSRVSYFNSMGDFVSNTYLVSSIKDGEVDIEKNEPVLDKSSSIGVGLVLIPPGPDRWANANPNDVFSIVKTIQGNDKRGFIEVQRPSSELYSLFDFKDTSHIEAVVFKGNGEILYSPFDTEVTDHYKSLTLALQPQNLSSENHPAANQKDLIVTSYSNYSDIYICLIQGQEAWLSPLSFINLQTWVFLFIVLLISVFYTIFFASRLTKPIRELKVQIQSANTENFNNTFNFQSSNDEVQSLKNAYLDMTDRLKKSIIKENEAAALQMRAQLDALQAQINPHFLYNVLNVLSYRGIKNDDETICDICENLASMLRYSTDTNNHFATISAELGYLESYIYLLKTRYQERISCSVTVDSQIAFQLLPKVVLQQFVENSVNHGYQKIQRQMSIEINGWLEADHWYISVLDNGQGFSQKTLSQLLKAIEEINQQFAEDKIVHQMEIGGMGLINTYTRLLLHFKEDLVFKITSNNENGSCVLIGAKMK